MTYRQQIDKIEFGLNQLLGEFTPAALKSVLSEYASSWASSYLNNIPEKAKTSDRVTDKMLPNFRNIGLIRLLLPGAKVIHISRNPLNTCLSMYFKLFNKEFPYSTDLQDLGHYYGQYASLMNHWRKVLPGAFMDLVYEDLVENPEEKTKEILKYCGLDWEVGCL